MASHEVLLAFVEAATQGSFSAAARKLGRSQSTISAAVASLEIDLNLTLFDRSSRKPGLTPAGRVVLQRAEDILAATSRLEMTASQLSQGVEAKLTVALSDTYQSDRFEASLSAFEQRYPDLELECLIAECDDLVALVQSGRAQLAFAEMQDSYPPDLVSSTVDERTEIALFVSPMHPLAALDHIDQDVLQQHRELRLATIVNPYESRAKGRMWSAPSYLMLLEMAQGGFGWAPLPRWLVARFGPGTLQELHVRGWPKTVSVDALWSRLHPPGPAGSWLLGKMLE
ncbi:MULTISPECIES: LysR family transcriptional regulator [unclassified Pseudomonas]|uniref:LysR family transcriptional regulator n=1 Tax=unclassified Pseudomonas TaxID=196821 RepID=UPI0007038A72|nr:MULTISPECIES: LysR family transcriptional regulator [unclassified Pseudomonas]KQZ93298.1 transcriptional regulator [Pseudomonas sp. Root562]